MGIDCFFDGFPSFEQNVLLNIFMAQQCYIQTKPYMLNGISMKYMTAIKCHGELIAIWWHLLVAFFIDGILAPLVFPWQLQWSRIRKKKWTGYCKMENIEIQLCDTNEEKLKKIKFKVCIFWKLIWLVWSLLLFIGVIGFEFFCFLNEHAYVNLYCRD